MLWYIIADSIRYTDRQRNLLQCLGLLFSYLFYPIITISLYFHKFLPACQPASPLFFIRMDVIRASLSAKKYKIIPFYFLLTWKTNWQTGLNPFFRSKLQMPVNHSEYIWTAWLSVIYRWSFFFRIILLNISERYLISFYIIRITETQPIFAFFFNLYAFFIIPFLKITFTYSDNLIIIIVPITWVS